MSATPQPGWYPDPAGSVDLYRWWDGQGWTDAVSETTRAPGPEDELAPQPGRPKSPLRTLLLLTCSIALFVAGGVGVGLVIWREPSVAGSQARDRPTHSPAPLASATPTTPAGQLDEATGRATIGPATLTFPGSPYELYEDPMQIPGVFDVFFLANAEVHEDYDGTNDWSATVGLAHLSSSLTQSDDIEQAGSTAVREITRHFFGTHPTAMVDLRTDDRSVDGHSGLLVTVKVSYAIPRLPSRYDTVTALVVRLDDGTLVAAVSSVPNDASADVKRLAQQSINSLSIS